MYYKRFRVGYINEFKDKLLLLSLLFVLKLLDE